VRKEEDGHRWGRKDDGHRYRVVVGRVGGGYVFKGGVLKALV
jgi:hypothetical protein